MEGKNKKRIKVKGSRKKDKIWNKTRSAMQKRGEAILPSFFYL
jgi:hypothetical protein